MARHVLSRISITAVVVLATVWGVVVAPSSGVSLTDGPVVATVDGVLAGMSTAGMTEFLGIPYAAPPVGGQRWRPPQPAARWAGVRSATAFAPHCAQPATSAGQASLSEDCLYLNVFAPAGHSSGRPVMVWIHGGALSFGESDDYDPGALVRDGVVVVTINYRLGALGFLAHPALAAQPDGPSGNYGLMDQQAALRWVRRNIAAFGGNAGDVTLFGQSAGGLSVLSQLASPGAHGLFTRAIVESGAYDPLQASLSSADAAGQAFAATAGCADQTAACLRNLPVSTILDNQSTSGYLPDVDGLVLVQPLWAAFATGRFNRVPVINGTNHDEYRQFVAQNELNGQLVTAGSYPFWIAGTLSAVFGIAPQVATADANVIMAQYPLDAYPSPPLALSALGTDAIYACTALRLNTAMARFGPTYGYEFNDENAPPPPAPPVSFPYAAEHSAELQYLFNLPGRLSEAQLRLAGTMQRYWTGFAARGFPVGTPFWAGFNGSAVIQSLVPGGTGAETDFATAHHCAFWATIG